MKWERILSVDDSDADQYLNEIFIHEQDPNIEVRAAYDGAEALELLRDPTYRPDLILLDINMPRMSGFEFLRAYEEEFGSSRSAAIVLLTSSGAPQDVNRADAFPALLGYLTKPLLADWIDRIAALYGDTRR